MKQSSNPLNIPKLPKKLSDNYKVVKVLGEGEFAIVLLAIHRTARKYVAIKAIDKAHKEIRRHPEVLKIEVSYNTICSSYKP